MYRSTLTAVAIAGLLAFGCEDKTEAEKAADNTADATANKVEEIKEKAQDGTAEVKKNAENAGETMGNRAENTADATQAGAENVKDEIERLAAKAKDALKDRKWSEAETHVNAIDALKAKLPEGARKPIDDMVAEVRKGIETGKALPAMPK